MQRIDVRYRVTRIMKASEKPNAREKLKELDRVLKNFEGKEEALITNCVKTYGEEPPPEPFEERVKRFISKRKPERMGEVPQLLQGYAGKELSLIETLHKEIGPEPEPPTPRRNAPIVGNTQAASSGSEIEQQKARLTRFYAHYCKDKTQADIDAAIQKYAGKDGGFTKMWKALEEKYGAESAVVSASPLPAAPLVAVTNSGVPASPIAATGTEIEQQKARLTRFYAHYCKDKTQADIDAAIQKYAGKDGGFAKMWRALEEKYGPEIAVPLASPLVAPSSPAPVQQVSQPSSPLSQATQPQQNTTSSAPQQQKERLRAFYDHYAAGEKTDADIDRAIDKYQRDPGGFDAMWRVLTAKYGPESAVKAKTAVATERSVVLPAAAANGGAAPVVSASPQASATPNDQHRERLRRFYAKYAKEKTEDDITKAIDRYSASPGGFEQMWAMLERKYGPEPTNAPPPVLVTIVKTEPSTTQNAAVPAADVWLTPELLKHKDRLLKFYAVYVPEKSEDEIVKALYRFKDAQGGLKAMWETLEKKYGPEPKDPNSELSVRDRLKKFYSHYAKEKTDADIDKIMKQYGSKPGGFDEMWLALERRYGVEDYNNPNAQPKTLTTKMPSFNYTKTAPPAAVIDDDPPPLGRAEERVRYGAKGSHVGAFSHGAAITVLHSLINFHGADFALYNRAPLDKRNVFREAVELDVAENILIAPRNVRVARFIAGPGGVLCEIDVELPMADGAEAIAETLVTKINIGSFTVGASRDAYRKALGGNPAQLFATEATVQVGQSKASTMKTIAVQGRLLNKEDLQQKQPATLQDDPQQKRALSLLNSVPPAPSAAFSPFAALNAQQTHSSLIATNPASFQQALSPAPRNVASPLPSSQRVLSQASPFLQSLWSNGSTPGEAGAQRSVLQPYPSPSQTVSLPLRAASASQAGLSGVFGQHYNFGSPQLGSGLGFSSQNILRPPSFGGGQVSAARDTSPRARDPATFSNIVTTLSGY
jgi:hypothetical protein